MTEHLIVLPDRDDAERLADELREEGFTEVRVVREALAGEDDSEDHEWAIYVREEMVDDDTGPVAEGLKANPALNATFKEDEKEIVYNGSENLAIAVDTPRGLLVDVGGADPAPGLAHGRAHRLPPPCRPREA